MLKAMFQGALIGINGLGQLPAAKIKVNQRMPNAGIHIGQRITLQQLDRAVSIAKSGQANRQGRRAVWIPPLDIQGLIQAWCDNITNGLQPALHNLLRHHAETPKRKAILQSVKGINRLIKLRQNIIIVPIGAP